MYKRILFLLLCLLTAALPALAEEEPWPRPYTGEMTGVWGFAGGAEEHGYGFRLNPDGTGVYLEIIDYEQVPLQYRDTEYTFTWRVERTADKTYLHETYADGRQVIYEIETWGSACIHIPNHISGGFYYPVLDEEARAYLAGKQERSAFDGMMMDYLDGSITGKIEAMGLQVGEIYLQQEQDVWQIAVEVCDNTKDIEARFLLREDGLRIWVDDHVWLWGDFDLGQSWFSARTVEEAYTRLPGILESCLTWEYAPQPTPEPEPSVIPELTAKLGSFPQNQLYDVYEGPRQDHLRAGGGKARVSTNGEISIYGMWLGRLLVEYEISGGRHRFGWVDTENLPASTLEGVPVFPFGRGSDDLVYGVVRENSWLTDDPFYDGVDPALFPISAGTSVHVFGRMDGWLLVEGFVDEELRMGFVPERAVIIEQGFAETAVYSIAQATRFTEADIRKAMNTVAAFIEEEWEGTSLMEIRYIEADSADPSAWWQDEAGILEGMLFYTDLNSIALWDAEIASYAIARDYLFIVYREPGGQWYVANWGYT